MSVSIGDMGWQGGHSDLCTVWHLILTILIDDCSHRFLQEQLGISGALGRTGPCYVGFFIIITVLNDFQGLGQAV